MMTVAMAARAAATRKEETRDRILETASQDVVAGRGQRAEVEAEDGRCGQTFAQIGLRHGELVEIDGERREGFGGAWAALRHGARF